MSGGAVAGPEIERLIQLLARVPGLGPRSARRAALHLIRKKDELLEPLGEDSPIKAFLEKNANGGIHHLCFEVDDIHQARQSLVASGARVLGDGNPKIGAHGKPVLFLHPKDFNGTLIELEQS